MVSPEFRVVVTYGLHQTRIQEVEELLTEIDYPPDDGFMSRKKRDCTDIAGIDEPLGDHGLKTRSRSIRPSSWLNTLTRPKAGQGPGALRGVA